MLLGITELTYRLIEVPCRRLTWARIKELFWEMYEGNIEPVRKMLVSFLTIPFILGATVIILTAPDLSGLQKEIADQINMKQQKLNDAKNNPTTSTLTAEEVTNLANFYDVDESKIALASESKLGFVGDSMFVFDYDLLTDLYRSSYIDGQIGRDPSMMPEAAQTMVEEHPDVEALVIAAGINTDDLVPMKTRQMEAVMQAAGNREVYWYNINLTKSQWTWTDEINEKLRKLTKKYPNLHLLDWYSPTIDRESEFLIEDMTHPNNQGFVIYNKLLLDALN